MKESYRLNKLSLIDNVANKNLKISILFSLNNFAYSIFKNLKYKHISNSMNEILNKINNFCITQNKA